MVSFTFADVIKSTFFNSVLATAPLFTYSSFVIHTSFTTQHSFIRPVFKRICNKYKLSHSDPDILSKNSNHHYSINVYLICINITIYIRSFSPE